MWKSLYETDEILRAIPDVDRLADLYALSRFWQTAVYPEGYRASSEWTDILVPSDAGSYVLRNLAPTSNGSSDPELWLALFGHFYHHDIFFDWRQTDATRIRALLEAELRSGRLRYPYRFGRLLYDRFNDAYDVTRTDHLLADQVQRLLENTPQGIYQLGPYVCGPLGIPEAVERRYIPPSLSLPLWHCSDTGCNAVHQVALFPPNIPVVENYRQLEGTLLASAGPPSEWRTPLSWRLRTAAADRSRPYVDLPLVLADCIVGSERTVCVEAALQSPSRDALRAALRRPPRRARDAEGSAAEVARRLSEAEQLQLLLLMPDDPLIQLIDEVIYTKRIRIPLGEIRRSRDMPPTRSRDTTSRVCVLGIQSIPDDPIVNLTSAIWRAYQSRGLGNELEWRIRSDPGRGPYEALLTFTRSRNPADVARELILSSPVIAKTVCDELLIPVARVTGSDPAAVDRLLWKFGFEPMLFDDFLPRFRSRLIEFRETVLAASPIETEDGRERARATGVNVFVSVEEFLDQLVSYNVWLLASDHFLDTKFVFELEAARKQVANTLGPHLPGEDAAFTWRTDGENTLGVLLRYLRVSLDWMESIEDSDRESLLRPAQDLPHFAADIRQVFPFRHTALWADSDPTELRRYRNTYATIVKFLEQADLPGIRNGLDHSRDRDHFPVAERMLASAARVDQALELADVNRFVPKIFWLYGRKSNRFGHVEYEFRDYAGRSTVVYGPRLVSGLLQPRYEPALLLAPSNLLGMPNASLTFALQHQSEYANFWKGYPRRRHIPGHIGEVAPTAEAS